ncbi:MAG: hypothetical protein JW795_23550 [Chitinivibrionales bacterium]|nr:hypothetical protein [Chitinivibrionales bacterium]
MSDECADNGKKASGTVYFQTLWVILQLCRILSLMLLSLPLLSPCQEISISSSIGFNGIFSIKKWTPLSVHLKTGSRAVSGTLVVRVTSGNELAQNVFTTSYTTEITLAANTVREYPLTIFIENVIHDLRLGLYQDSMVVSSEAVNLRSIYTDKPLVVIVNNAPLPEISESIPTIYFPAQTQPEGLPHEWYGYDGVAAILLTAEVIVSLQPDQHQALKQWVGQGGKAIFCSGQNYGLLFDAKVRDLIALNVRATMKRSALNCLEFFTGEKVVFEKDFLLLDVLIEQSETLLSEDSIPVVAQKKIGSGSVTFIAFDFRHAFFSLWKGQTNFWDRILAAKTTPAAALHGVDDVAVMNAVVSHTPSTFPNFFIMIALGCVYMTGLYWLLHQMKKKTFIHRTNPVTVVLYVVAISVAAAAYFFYREKRCTVTTNNFLHKHQKTYAFSSQTTLITGIYSQKKNTVFIIFKNEKTNTPDVFSASTGPITMLVAPKSRQKVPDQPSIKYTDTAHILQVNSKPWSANFFKQVTVTDPWMVMNVQKKSADISLFLKNLCTDTLHSCFIFFNNRIHRIDDIQPNELDTISIQADDTTLDSRVNTGIAHNDSLPVSDHVFDVLFPELTPLQKEVLSSYLSQFHTSTVSDSVSPVLYFIGWGFHTPFSLLRDHSVRSSGAVAMHVCEGRYDEN